MPAMSRPPASTAALTASTLCHRAPTPPSGRSPSRAAVHTHRLFHTAVPCTSRTYRLSHCHLAPPPLTGWCYDEQDCLQRSKGSLGSSHHFPATAGCGCMNVVGDGLDPDCNCVFLPYGDGASFSGYRAATWPVPGYPGQNLTFRGIRNLDATVEWAIRHGLSNATELVVTGGSAGGLSTFLHAGDGCASKAASLLLPATGTRSRFPTPRARADARRSRDRQGGGGGGGGAADVGGAGRRILSRSRQLCALERHSQHSQLCARQLHDEDEAHLLDAGAQAALPNTALLSIPSTPPSRHPHVAPPTA
eukprot:6606300-Prymnesium_polylepis.1